MQVIDCPHCLRRVGLASGSLCPACGKDTADISGVDRDREVIWVAARQRVPDLCSGCGSPTIERVRVTGQVGERIVERYERSAGDILLGFLGLLLVPFISIFFILHRAFLPESSVRHRVSKVAIRLPCCKSCRPVPAPISVDAGRRSLKLSVHRSLASAMLTDGREPTR